MQQKAENLKRFYEAACILPPEFREAAEKLTEQEKLDAEEFRLRTAARPSVLLRGRERALETKRSVTPEDLSAVVDTVSSASVHSLKENLRQGYLTARGGHRVGLCGRAVLKEGAVDGFKYFSSLSVRIAKEMPGIASELAGKLLDGQCISSTLILSPPGGGKTTLLRDLVRALSDELGLRVAVVDERGELAAMRGGTAQFTIGRHTDVIDFCPKNAAVRILLRCMNPQVIALDELAAERDEQIVLDASGCGVGLLATAHAGSAEEFYMRPAGRRLLSHGVFRTAVVIENKNGLRTTRIERIDGLCSNG